MNDHLAGFFHRGAVRVEERDVYDPALSLEALRFKVGMVFQKPNPFPLSIADNVLFGPSIAGVSDKQALEETLVRSLQRANLWDEVKDASARPRWSSPAGSSSACASPAASPARPTSCCSTSRPRRSTRSPPRASRRPSWSSPSDVTILLVTHNLLQAARVATRTAFLYLGNLVEEGETTQLFSAPRERLTEEYVTGRFG